MTEEQIERKVSRKIDSLDKVFMNSDMSQEEYDSRMREIKAWAEKEYDARRCDDECTVCGKGFDNSVLSEAIKCSKCAAILPASSIGSLCEYCVERAYRRSQADRYYGPCV